MLRPATLEDAFDLEPRLRDQDVVELTALGHPSMLTALTSSIAMSEESWAFEVDGVVHAIGGVTDAGDGTAIPWLLGSSDLFSHRKALMTLPAQCIQRWASKYPLLTNFVHTENKVSIAWLKRLGFTIHPPIWFGGGLFHQFTMKGSAYVRSRSGDGRSRCGIDCLQH